MRLHVDRPCQVHRGRDGRWGWRCSICPPPLCQITETSRSWRAALAEAAQHLQGEHAPGLSQPHGDGGVLRWRLAS